MGSRWRWSLPLTPQQPGHLTARPLPAPQRPEGRRPVCIQSLFILCRSLRAVMDTSWFLSPNSSRWAKRGMYRQGSVADTRLSAGPGQELPCHRQPAQPPFRATLPPFYCADSLGSSRPGTCSLPDLQLGVLSARVGGCCRWCGASGQCEFCAWVGYADPYTILCCFIWHFVG